MAGLGTALALDAATFGASAVALVALVRERPQPREEVRRLGDDVAEGVRLVARTPILLRMLGFGVLGSVVMVAPEGLAVPVAHHVGGGARTAGVLSAAVPAGFLIGSFLVLRGDAERRAALLPPRRPELCAPVADALDGPR